MPIRGDLGVMAGVPSACAGRFHRPPTACDARSASGCSDCIHASTSLLRYITRRPTRNEGGPSPLSRSRQYLSVETGTCMYSAASSTYMFCIDNLPSVAVTSSPRMTRPLIAVNRSQQVASSPVGMRDQLNARDAQTVASADVVLGRRLRALREERNWSQADVVSELGRVGLSWHQTTAAKVEAGSRPLKASEVLALSIVLGVPVQDLFNDNGQTSKDFNFLQGMHSELQRLAAYVGRRTAAFDRSMEDAVRDGRSGAHEPTADNVVFDPELGLIHRDDVRD